MGLPIILRILVFLGLGLTLVHISANDLEDTTISESEENSEGENTEPSDVIELGSDDDENTGPEYWDGLFGSGRWLVEFYSPECAICANVSLIWEEVATLAKTKALDLKVAKLDVKEHKFGRMILGVGSLPTIKLFVKGVNYTMLEPRELRTAKQYIKYATKTYKKEARQRKILQKVEEEKVAREIKDRDLTTKVIRLTPKTFSQVGTGDWVIDFYGSKCTRCKKIDNKWEKLAYFAYRNKMKFKVARFDCLQKGGKAIEKSFKANPWPAIVRVKDGMAYSHPESQNFDWDVEDYIEWAETGFMDEHSEKFMPEFWEKLLKRAARQAKYGTKKKKKDEL